MESNKFWLAQNTIGDVEIDEGEENSFDALHADQLCMASYVAERGGPATTVLDQHNAVFLVPRRFAANSRNPLLRTLLGSEAAKLARYERATCRRFDHVVWVSEQDREAVAALGDAYRRNDRVIPIATDPSASAVIERPRPFRITFIGGMHWPPNAEGVSWFAKEAWPAIAAAAPHAVLTLIGKGAPKRLGPRALASRVEAPGYVADLKAYLSETAVFIVPLKAGAGMRVKILDAWCWGLPIVSTTDGAEGIEAAREVRGTDHELDASLGEQSAYRFGRLARIRQPVVRRAFGPKASPRVSTSIR